MYNKSKSNNIINTNIKKIIKNSKYENLKIL